MQIQTLQMKPKLHVVLEFMQTQHNTFKFAQTDLKEFHANFLKFHQYDIG